MTGVTGLLSLIADQRPSAPVTAAIASTGSDDASLDAVIDTPAEQRRYTGIVIHHSGSNQGSAETLRAEHKARGLMSLGYHFVIGNGRGASDGSIQPGERWSAQQPGAHVVGPSSLELNSTTIGVCLIGNGDTRPFSDAQLTSLLALITELQEKYDIPRSAVMLHRDVAPTASPGRLFPDFAFKTQLAGS